MVYINEIEKELLEACTNRELALFKALEGKVHIYQPSVNDLEDLLCCKAYSGHQATSEYKKLAGVEPFKGLHYSKNLVTQVAAYIQDNAAEEENLRRFVESHSYRELYIVNKYLGKNYDSALAPISHSDIVAEVLTQGKKVTPDLISSFINNVSDIFDLYILKEAITSYLLDLKESKQISIFEKVVCINRRVIKRLELFFSSVAILVLGFTSLKVSPVIISYFVNNWDDLEAKSFLLTTVVSLLVTFGVISVIKLNQLKRKIISFYFSCCFRLIGVDYIELKKLHKKLEQ